MSTTNLTENPPIRRIAHLDMDAFFASIELLRYPQLKGLPVVIGGGRRKVDEELLAAQGERALRFIPVADFPLLKDYVGRGVITTATYAARQFGVGSAMGMMKAANPDEVLMSKTVKDLMVGSGLEFSDRGMRQFGDVPES